MKGVQKDLSNLKFGKLTVINMAETKKDKNGNNIYCWNCVCDCGKQVIVSGINLRNGTTKSCGCLVKETRKTSDDLTGKKFHRLTVLEQVEDYIDAHNRHYSRWKCLCECGNEKIVQGRNLKSGKTKSCGCYKKELNSQKRKENIYDLSKEYGVCYAGNTHNIIKFDLEDYELIKKYYWIENSNGYAVANSNKTVIYMHRLIMNIEAFKSVIDHRYHDCLDNRKKNLRITDAHHNTMNEKLAINNTSGTTGVSLENGKWRAYLWYNGKTLHFGTFDKIEDAIEARIKAENYYFGEFGYHNSMKHKELQEVLE